VRPRADSAQSCALHLRFFRMNTWSTSGTSIVAQALCQSLFDAPCQNACPTDQNAWGYVT